MPKRSSKRFTLSVVAIGGISSVFALPPASGIASGRSSAEVIHVTIDVKPGDKPTTIEPKREGMVPIAILTTREFDATRVDPATVRAGATGTEAAVFRSASEDIDRDGDTDMLLLFRVQQMGLECDGMSVSLKGQARDGQEIEGTEAVKMVGCA